MASGRSATGECHWAAGSVYRSSPPNSRIRAAVLGLNGAEPSAEAAAQLTVPPEFLVQWDDEMVPRAASLDRSPLVVSPGMR
ncbi:hypothetical protein C8K30_103277 [Promicromonospora sp. AC04]|nr:hypothetical protein C8K30_103277 [Promicromonospora sp. AC04]